MLDVDLAVALLGSFARLRKLAEAGTALVARRLDACGAHRRDGYASTAHLVAATAGIGLDRAIDTVETGRRVRDQSATDGALRTGALSIDQASLISEAVSADPGAEARLLVTAGRETLRTLRERSRAVQAAADDDRVARHERQRACRSFRHGVDREGMVWGHFRLPPEKGAGVVSRIEREADREFPPRVVRGPARDARAVRRRCADGRRHGRGLAPYPGRRHPGAGRAGARLRGAEVVVHVSHGAMRRGRVESGEICLVEGFGDVPVDVARRSWTTRSSRACSSTGRASRPCATSAATSPRRCGRRYGSRPWCATGRSCARPRDATGERESSGTTSSPTRWGGPTEAANLQPLCRYHHREKTRATARESGRPPAHAP